MLNILVLIPTSSDVLVTFHLSLLIKYPFKYILSEGKEDYFFLMITTIIDY